jgi:hypothetical protein
MKLEDDILDFATDSGEAEMIELVLQRTGFPVDDDDDAEGKKWRGERLTKDERASIEKVLGRSVMYGFLDALHLLLSYLLHPTENRAFQYYPIRNNRDIINIFNATEDAIPRDNSELFELVWESFISPPTSVLDKDPAAKAQQQEWLHRRLISAAAEGALRTATLIIEKYKANPNHISMKYHITPLFSAASQGYIEFVRYLLDKHNVDTHVGNGKYANGPTALHIAILSSNQESCDYCSSMEGPWNLLISLFCQLSKRAFAGGLSIECYSSQGGNASSLARADGTSMRCYPGDS